MLCFIAFCRYCIFYKLKVCGNPVSSTAVSASFQTAFVHFMCHISLILQYFKHLYYYHIYCADLWSVIFDVTITKRFQMMVSIFYQRIFLIRICALFFYTWCHCTHNRLQFSSVAQSCPTLCSPMDCNMPGLPVHHQLLEFTQTYVHWVGDAIQPSHSLSSPSPPAFNLSQHQGLFQWVRSSHQVAKVLEF